MNINNLKFNILILFWVLSLTLRAQPFCQKENIFGETVFVSNHNLENSKIKTPSFWLNNSIENIEISRDTIIWKSNKTTFKRIWKNTNPNLQIIPQKQTDYYFTGKYSFDKNYGFHEIYIKDLYPGIDLIYSIENQKLKYSLVIQKNGNLDDINFCFDGIEKIEFEAQKLIIKSNFENWQEFGIKLIHNDQIKSKCYYKLLNNNNLKFGMSEKITKPFIIDPFLIKINNLDDTLKTNKIAVEINKNCVYDLEYDCDGNVYVYGGSGYPKNTDSASLYPYNPIYNNYYKTAKYSKTGKLKWIYFGMDTISNFFDNLHASGISINKYSKECFLTRATKDGYLNLSKRIISINSNGAFIDFAPKTPNNLCNRIHSTMVPPTNINDSVKLIALTDYFNGKEGLAGLVYKDSTQTSLNCTQLYGRQNAYDGISRGINSFLISDFHPGGSTYPFLNLTKYDFKMRKIIWKQSFNNMYMLFSSLYGYMRNKTIPNFNFLIYSGNSIALNDSILVFFGGKNIIAFQSSNGKIILKDTVKNLYPKISYGVAIDPCNNIFLAGDSSKIYCYHLKDTLLTLKKTLNIDNKKQRYLFDLEYNAQSNLIYITGDSILAAIQSPFACKDSSMISVLDSVNNICNKPIVAGLKKQHSESVYSFEWTDTTTHKVVRSVDKIGNATDTLANPVDGHVYKLRIMKNKTNMGLFTDLFFNVLKSSKDTQTIHGCAGNSVKVAHKMFTTNATINDTLTNALGCDSVITYKIVFHPTFKDTFHYKGCIGDTLKFGNKFITSSGIYHDTFNTIWQCDSFILRDVKFFGSTDTQTIHICRVASFKAGNHTYSKTGFYRDTFKNANPCDSIICTNLIVHNDTIYTVKHQICSNDSIKLAVKFRKLAGIYTDSFHGLWGCDSVIHHQLVVHKTSTDTVKFHLCKGQAVYINGNKYNSPREFSSELKNQFGCDSLVYYVITQSNMNADFNIDTTDKPMLIFKNKSFGNTKFFWDFGDQSKDSTNKDPTHTYNNDQPHFVRICLSIVDSFGCNDTICQSVEISKLTYWIFNSFSPGSDGYNDIFKIGHKGGSFNYNMMVYNRWGALVYETQNASIKDESKFWNGKVMNSGEDCPEGTYFVIYQLYLEGPSKSAKEIHGTVNLVK